MDPLGPALVPRRFRVPLHSDLSCYEMAYLGTGSGPGAHFGFTLLVHVVWLEFVAAPSLASVFGHCQSCAVVAACRGLPCNRMPLFVASLRRFPSRKALYGLTSFRQSTLAFFRLS